MPEIQRPFWKIQCDEVSRQKTQSDVVLRSFSQHQIAIALPLKHAIWGTRLRRQRTCGGAPLIGPRPPQFRLQRAVGPIAGINQRLDTLHPEQVFANRGMMGEK